jgi:Arc/MetJ-type ribon-helix-helix transcriptional regulator
MATNGSNLGQTQECAGDKGAIMTIHLSLPPELVKKVDELAKQDFVSRSEYVKQAILEKIDIYTEWQAMLAGLILHAPVPDELELKNMLQKRITMRQIAEDEKEWRRQMRRRSLKRKSRRVRGL